MNLAFWLSIVLAASSCTGLIVAGRGRWQGWAIGLATQPVWASYALITKGYGLLLTCAMFTTVYTKNLIKWIKEARPEQTTWCFCPGCKKDLCTGNNVIMTDTDLVRYFCGDCNIVSVWNFDMPVPMLIDAYYQDPNDWFKAYRETDKTDAKSEQNLKTKSRSPLQIRDDEAFPEIRRE